MTHAEIWPPKPPVVRVVDSELLSAIQHGSHLAVEAFILSRLVSDDARYSEFAFGSVSVTTVVWAAALQHEKVVLLLMKPSFDYLAAIGSGVVSLLAASHSNALVFSTILRQLQRDYSRECAVEHDRTTLYSVLATSNFTGNSVLHLLSATDAHIPLILCLAALSPLPVAEYSALISVAIEILTCESKNQRADGGVMRIWSTLCSAAIRHCCSCDLVSKALRLQNGFCDTPVHVAVRHSALNVMEHIVVRVDLSSILCTDAMGNSALHLALQTREVCPGLLACLLLQHRIRLMLTLDSFNALCPSSVSKNCAWDESVCNKRNGGPIASFLDFWASDDATTAWQDMAEFVVDRWGRSPAVAFIELVNDVDMADALGLAPHSHQWHVAAATRIKRLNAFQSRPVCQSFAIAKDELSLDSNAAFDLTTSHVYQRDDSDRGDIAGSTSSYTAAKVPPAFLALNPRLTHPCVLPSSHTCMRVAVVTFFPRRLHRSTNQLWSPNLAATTCLDSASRLPVCTLAYGLRGCRLGRRGCRLVRSPAARGGCAPIHS